MEPADVNGSVHTAASNVKGFAFEFVPVHPAKVRSDIGAQNV